MGAQGELCGGLCEERDGGHLPVVMVVGMK